MSWQTVRLSDICDLQNGYAFKSSDYIEESNVLNCRMSNIRPDGNFDIFYHPKFLPNNFADKYKEFLLSDDDVIIAMTDMAGEPKILGVPTIVKTHGKKILLNQRVGKLIFKQPVLINFNYLKYILSDKKVKQYYRKFANGGVQINLSKPDLLSIKITLPPISEQKRIAAILDKADEIRRKREQAITKLEQLAQSIFVEMFGDPVTNNKGWEITKLGNVGTLDRGISKHRPRNAPELLGGNHPLIQTGDVANCDGYIRTYISTYSDIGLKQSKKWIAGTLCITIAANIAKTGILTFDSCFPDSIVGFSANNIATIEYVRIWLSFLQKTLEDNAPVSAQKNINLAILRELPIPLPPIALQEEFAKRINQIEKLKAYNTTALANHNALFASLQQQAFSGNL
jgi:type I restriction enzyme S subunit